MVGIQQTTGRASETQINSQNSATVTGNQANPTSVVFANGNAAVFYENPYVNNQSDIDIQGTYINTTTGLPTGAVIGRPGIGFNSTVDLHPEVSLIGNGTSIAGDKALLVWDSFNSVANTRQIFGQLVDQNGQTLTTMPFLIDGLGVDQSADVAGLTTGGAAIVWQDNTGGVSKIVAKILQTDGQTTAVPDFRVDTTGGTAPVVSALPGNRFVVAWVGTDVSGPGIHAQIFDQTGARIGNELGTTTNPLNVITQGQQTQVSIATLSNGNFVVAWTDDSTRAGAADQTTDTSGTAVKARVFNASGLPVSEEITVNTSLMLDQSLPSVTAGPNGGFVVGWTDASQQPDSNGVVDPSGTAIKAQAFDATGAKIGGELLVNSVTNLGQSEVNLTTGGSGQILATFQDFSAQLAAGSSQTADTSGSGIQSASLMVAQATTGTGTTGTGTTGTGTTGTGTTGGTSDGLNPVFRFYDTVTNDHFYTTSASEKAGIQATLPTFTYEGAPWSTPTAGSNTTDVFRFYDTVTKTHFLTQSVAEKTSLIQTQPTFTYEGVAFEAYTSIENSNEFALERFYNTNSHVHTYSASPQETAGIIAGQAGQGWVDEGASFIVHKPA